MITESFALDKENLQTLRAKIMAVSIEKIPSIKRNLPFIPQIIR
jgi:hypothetical protein